MIGYNCRLDIPINENLNHLTHKKTYNSKKKKKKKNIQINATSNEPKM